MGEVSKLEEDFVENFVAEKEEDRRKSNIVGPSAVPLSRSEVLCCVFWDNSALPAA